MFEEELLEKTAVCTEILQDARNELYLNMRFLDVALNSLSLQRLRCLIMQWMEPSFIMKSHI